MISSFFILYSIINHSLLQFLIGLMFICSMRVSYLLKGLQFLDLVIRVYYFSFKFYAFYQIFLFSKLLEAFHHLLNT